MHPLNSVSILAVDDNRGVLRSLKMLFAPICKQFSAISSPERVREKLRTSTIDVVLLDMNFKAGINTGNEGIYWLREIQKADPNISVVLITAYGDVELAVKAIKEDAFDFVLKPWNNEKLLATVEAAYRLTTSRREVSLLRGREQHLISQSRHVSERLTGQSPEMLQMQQIIEKVSVTDANVLITGENGTGKELVAREIHQNSNRSENVLVSVDMGAIPETLMESELFGHVKGAFTDAGNDVMGKFQTAEGGTLFLDEIGNLPLTSQSKILTTLQNRSIRRVGDHREIPLDIRLICATNCDLKDQVRNGLFREDLLYRINTITIEVPPLRNRGDDILELARHFTKRYSEKYGKPAKKISAEAQLKLMDYNWPGNVRELQHMIEKAVILCDGEELVPADFYIHEIQRTFVTQRGMTLEAMEKAMIESAIRRHNSNLSAVAGELGITRPTLYNKIRKYGL